MGDDAQPLAHSPKPTSHRLEKTIQNQFGLLFGKDSLFHNDIRCRHE